MSMSAIPHPFVVHRIRLREELELSFVDEGEGPHTLLLVHGLGSSKASWYKLITRLRSHFRVLALDLPGYGESSKGDFSGSMDFFAGILREFIYRMALQRVVAVGHSMGGQIVLALALQHGSLLQRMVLLAPAGFETFTEVEGLWIRNLYRPALLRAVPFSRTEKNIIMNFHHFPEDAQFMIDQRRELEEDSAAFSQYCQTISRCVEGMIVSPVFDRLEKISLPSLTIFGLEDAFIPNRMLHPRQSVQKVAEAGHRQLLQDQLCLLKGCGHMLQWECSEKVAARIRAFLEV